MILNEYCRRCWQLDRTTGTCEKHKAQLQALTVNREIKWIKCQDCVEEGEKKLGEVE